jgi:hypothetical protein
MAEVITDAGKPSAGPQLDSKAVRKMRVTAIAKALREAKSDEAAADALEAALLLGPDTN